MEFYLNSYSCLPVNFTKKFALFKYIRLEFLNILVYSKLFSAILNQKWLFNMAVFATLRNFQHIALSVNFRTKPVLIELFGLDFLINFMYHILFSTILGKKMAAFFVT